MIQLLELGDPALRDLPGHPMLSAQLEAMAASAGGGVLREFWTVREGEDKAPSGWLCRSGDSCWAMAEGTDAAGELAAFLAFLTPSLLQCDGPVARALENSSVLPEYKPIRRPCLMGGGASDKTLPRPRARVQVFAPGDPSGALPLMDLHTQAGEVPRGERWDKLYAELHLRCRRGVAAVALGRAQEQVVSAAALGAIGTRAAVLSHVCTLPAFRRRGFASLTVEAACRLAGELGRVPVLCCREELVPFYHALGFVDAGAEYWIFRTGETEV